MFSRMKSHLALLSLVFLSFFVFGYAFADSAVVQPQDFLAQILQAVAGFGGLSWMGKVSAICLLIVASMKVSFLQPLWAKLPPIVQTLAAPMIALIGGLLGSAVGGQSLTLASALAYVGAGGGAVILHELLDGVKTIPGIGAVMVAIINIIEAIPVIGSGGKQS